MEALIARYKIHHRVSQCLLRLHDKALGTALDGEGVEAWLEWEAEALRWRVSPEIGRDDLEALVEAFAVVLEREDHRRIHSEASDFARWGRRGGFATLQRYIHAWFALLGRRRHGRISSAQLMAAAAELSGNRRQPTRSGCGSRKGDSRTWP